MERMRSVLSMFLAVITIRADALEIKFGVYYSNSSLTGGSNFATSAGAITIAERDLREAGIIGNDVIFKYILPWKPPNAQNEVYYSGKTVELWDQGVDVLIGPRSSTNAIPVGYLATYWNLPFLVSGATAPEFRNKKRYRTMIRTYGDTSSFGAAIENLFSFFGWVQYGKIIEKRIGICSYYDDALSDHTRFTESALLEPAWFYPEVDEPVSRIDKNLKRMKGEARVFLLCTNAKQKRQILLRARALNMTGGDYVWITLSSVVENSTERPWYVEGKSDNDKAKDVYRVVMDMTWSKASDTTKEQQLKEENARELAKPPWNYREPLEKNIPGSETASYIYDTFYVYGILLNKTMARNCSHRNGTAMFEFAKGLDISGASGRFYLDELADRKPDYWLWDYDKVTGIRVAVMEIPAELNKSVKITGPEIDWNNEENRPPRDSPECGFLNNECPKDYSTRDNIIISVTILVLMAICTILGLLYYRRRKKKEDELNSKFWKIEHAEITVNKLKAGLGSQMSFYSQISHSSDHEPSTGEHKSQYFTLHGTYRGQNLAIKYINVKQLQLNREDLVELKVMRDMTHDNINQFVGLCIEPENTCILYSYCSKGSLLLASQEISLRMKSVREHPIISFISKDLLENEDIKLDNVFKVSMMQDLCTGLEYIHHQSPLKSHGLLKSSNCVIDSRWVLRLTDFGLAHIVSIPAPDQSEYQKYRRLWWTAPELLRDPFAPARGTQAGDIYAMAVIMYEITYRRSPYTTDNLAPRDHVERVMKLEAPPYRPVLGDDLFHPVAEELITDCWVENPDDRLTFRQIKQLLKKINGGKKLNLIDHMVEIMEKYANNLEELVESRTKELHEEKQKTDMLLHKLLPDVVADKLKIGESVEPETFDEVSIYFSDIVGFTRISAASTPMQVVTLLNDLYSTFDACIQNFDVYKVETIGDAYMVASGLPRRNGHRHAGEIADTALALREAVLSFKIRHMPEVLLIIRIGLHSGPCCAGVVGLSMPRYCLFGGTVTIANSMESSGQGMRIHISQECHDVLEKLGGYRTEERIRDDENVKSTRRTYWLNGKNGEDRRTPNQYELRPQQREDGLYLRGSCRSLRDCD